MNGYIGFYNGKRCEVYAPTRYQAYEQAVNYFKPPKSKRHMVTVVLCEKDGVNVAVAID